MFDVRYVAFCDIVASCRSHRTLWNELPVYSFLTRLPERDLPKSMASQLCYPNYHFCFLLKKKNLLKYTIIVIIVSKQGRPPRKYEWAERTKPPFLSFYTEFLSSFRVFFVLSEKNFPKCDFSSLLLAFSVPNYAKSGRKILFFIPHYIFSPHYLHD